MKTIRLKLSSKIALITFILALLGIVILFIISYKQTIFSEII